MFSWHSLDHSLPTEHHLVNTAYLNITADHAHPFMITVCTHLLAPSSMIIQNVTKLKSSQTGFLNIRRSSLCSAVIRHQSMRESLGCDGVRDSHHGADKASASLKKYDI